MAALSEQMQVKLLYSAAEARKQRLHPRQQRLYYMFRVFNSITNEKNLSHLFTRYHIPRSTDTSGRSKKLKPSFKRTFWKL